MIVTYFKEYAEESKHSAWFQIIPHQSQAVKGTELVMDCHYPVKFDFS